MSRCVKHRAKKRFGQHFLTDPHLIEQIVLSAALQADHNVVEIGPGTGALTRPLLSQLRHLHVIELDTDLIPQLHTLPQATNKLHVHETDALSFNFANLALDQPLRLIGNLPYNISTPLLFHLLHFKAHIVDMLFMLQKEVVERLTAQANGRRYSRLSVVCQYHYQTNWLFNVPPEAFDLPPKVDSAVVHLTPHAAPPAEIGDEMAFDQVLRAAFAQRRKTVKNNLKSIMTAEQIQACGIDPSARAQSLTMADFASLAKALAN